MNMSRFARNFEQVTVFIEYEPAAGNGSLILARIFHLAVIPITP